jgi:hypothetical protein
MPTEWRLEWPLRFIVERLPWLQIVRCLAFGGMALLERQRSKERIELRWLA